MVQLSGDYRIDEVSSLREVQAAAWERICAGGGLYLSRQWLLSMEPQPDFGRHYLLASDRGGRLVGALPNYSYPRSDLYDLYNPFSQFVDRPPGAARPDEWFPLLLGGTRSGYRNELLVDRELGEPAQTEIAAQLVAATLALAERVGARAIAYLYLTREALDRLRPHFGPQAVPLLSSAQTRLELAGATFDDYLGQLGKDARKVARREMARFAEAGCTVSEGRLGEWYPKLAPLLSVMQHQHGAQMSVDRARDYLGGVAAHLDDHSVVLLCHQGDELIAFCLCCWWGETLYTRLIGYDRARVGRIPVYFQLTFYEPVRYALAHGQRAIEFGPTTYEAKIQRGARLAPLWALLVGPPGPWREALAGWNDEQLRSLNDRFARQLGGPLPESPWRL